MAPKKGHMPSPEHLGKLMAAGRRYHRLKNAKLAAMASGRRMMPGVAGTNDFRPERAHLNVTPAVWMSAQTHVGDCQYVDDPVDEVLLRAVRERVVYADRLGHHEPCFQEVTIATLAAVEKECRKKGPWVQPPVAKGLLKPFKLKKPPTVVVTAPKVRKNADLVKVAKATGHREGRPLTEVVTELFE